MSSDTATPENKTSPSHFTNLPWCNRLSNKLLILTALAVLIAEILILAPSVANMRERWMSGRLDTIHAVSDVLAASGSLNIPRDIQDKVLLATGTKAIALRTNGASHLLAMNQIPDTIDQVIDLDNMGRTAAIWDAFNTLFNGSDKTLRIYSSYPLADGTQQTIEIVTSDAPMREAMIDYATRVMVVSLLISGVAASLIYFIVRRLMWPLRIMYRNMIDFAANPDNPDKILIPENRKDEFGIAQRQIAHIQNDLYRMLKEQKRLVDLGLAVSKINHDMRNILAYAQLVSDRLADTQDPVVQSLSPKLIHALNRAIGYSESVMAYGRSQEAPPRMRSISLNTIIADVQETLNLSQNGAIEFENLVAGDFQVTADPEQMFRVLSNLCRNAIQAMERNNNSSSAVKRLTISAGHIGGTIIIGVEDTGPGLAQKARDHLFTAFRGSTRSDGSGLGLVIAQELIQAHGGTLELREDRPIGAHFEIRLPQRSLQQKKAGTHLQRENMQA